MYIAKLSLTNYRNFKNVSLVFKKGVNTIIGENGSGKSNIFRAVRLLLDENLRRSAIRLEEKDFHRGLGDWRGHWIIISLEFDEISADEEMQSLFLHGAGVMGVGKVEKATYNLIFRPKQDIRFRFSQLKADDQAGFRAIREEITINDYEPVFTGKSSGNFNDQTFYKQIVGDFDKVIFDKRLEPAEIGIRIPGLLSVSQQVSFTFVQALRDVVAEFQSNRTNPLYSLLKSKSGDINAADFEPIAVAVKTLNEAIEGLGDVKGVRADIEQTIKDTAGETYSPTSLSIKSDLPDEAEKLFQSLKLFVGESDDAYEGPIHELSLGGANLVYLTLKLLDFQYQKVKKSLANFLLIEEPEAHIHTHIQKTLFDRLNFKDTQIIYSTHSTHISEVSNINNVNILGKKGRLCEVYQPANGLSSEEANHIQRYLDAVRSNLLFAKSVILVEGDAEEILIPVLVKNVLGVSLDELGISLINIRSTGFKNVALLFNDQRILKKCGILTDLDISVVDTTPAQGDTERMLKFKKHCQASEEKGAARKKDLDSFCSSNQWLQVNYAKHTFEVDFLAAGNAEIFVKVLTEIYSDPATIAKATAELRSANVSQYGTRALTLAQNTGKGWFAILLGRFIKSSTQIPGYILESIAFASSGISEKARLKILQYRYNKVFEMPMTAPLDKEAVAAFHQVFLDYRDAKASFRDLQSAFGKIRPDDPALPLLAML